MNNSKEQEKLLENESAVENQRSLRHLYAAMKVYGRVLDVGCNSGFFSQYMPSNVNEYIGIDSDPALIGKATTLYGTKKRFHFQVCDFESVEHLPFEPESFDCVVCMEVIEHLDDCQPILQKMREVLMPDGLLILSTPAPILTGKDYNPDHKHEYLPDKLQLLLQKTGYRAVGLQLVSQNEYRWFRLLQIWTARKKTNKVGMADGEQMPAKNLP
nr:class I SAM-dependent methyltransferase [uncultured Nitrososphaera sp.]